MNYPITDKKFEREKETYKVSMGSERETKDKRGARNKMGVDHNLPRWNRPWSASEDATISRDVQVPDLERSLGERRSGSAPGGRGLGKGWEGSNHCPNPTLDLNWSPNTGTETRTDDLRNP